MSTAHTARWWISTAAALALVGPAALVATPVDAATPQAQAAETGQPGRLHPLPPARLLDTRRTAGPVSAGADRRLVVAGNGGVPATGVSAVVLNVTVTLPSRAGDLQVHPVGQRPLRRTSNLNWRPGQTVAVQVQTGLGDGGQVAFSVSHGAAHVVVDVSGWYGDSTDADSTASGYTALPPRRVLDTREEDRPVHAGSPRTVPLAGRDAIPAGATAVMLNATMLGTPDIAHLQVSPTGQPPEPPTSNLNVARGETRANAVVAPLGDDGSIDLAVSQHSAHVVLDVVGYYSPDSPGRFVTLPPTRILDTREAGGAVAAGSDREAAVAGRGAVPLNADAAVLSVTATAASAPMDLQVYPPGSRPQRRTSTLNLGPGTAVPNLAVAPLGTGGRVGLSVSQGQAHVVLDVLGYFTIASWSLCRSEEGWTAQYPAAWRTNPGTTVAGCRLFHPEPFVLQPGTEIPPGISVNLHRAQVDVQQARSDAHSRLISEQERTVDGRLAYRQLRETTEDGYVPAGTRYLHWLVDVGGETVSGTAYDWHEPSFERKVEFLDQMMERIRIDDRGAQEPGSWSRLPAAPVEPRSLHSTTWAGDRLVVWGGGDDTGVHADGVAWVPGTQQWERVPPAPLTRRWNHHAVWTGSELIVWGGDEGPDDQASCFTDGARYDPTTRAWRAMAQAPGEGRCAAAVVWTGTELLAFGGFHGSGVPTEDQLHDDGLGYDPATDRWRTLPPAPLSPRSSSMAGWSGSELVVWGGTGAGVQPVGGGAAYDPSTDTWRAIAESPLAPAAGIFGTFAGSELLVMGGHDRATDTYRTQAAAYDPTDDRWRTLPDLPRGQVQPDVAWTGGVLYVVGGDARAGQPAGGAFLAYVQAEDAWVVQPDPPGGPRIQHGVAWSGSRLYTWGGVLGAGGHAPAAVWRPPS